MILTGFPSIVRSNVQSQALSSARAAISDVPAFGAVPSYESKLETMQGILGSPGESAQITGTNAAIASITNRRQLPTMGLINLDNGDAVLFRFAPRELKFGGENYLQPIHSMGRNNPFYQYTGSEQNLEFEIDWFQMDENSPTVVEVCKKIESWGKNDSTFGPPARIKVIWGRTLLTESVWLIANCQHIFTQFYQNRDLMPIAAKQQIKLVKITSTNSSWEDIQRITN